MGFTNGNQPTNPSNSLIFYGIVHGTVVIACIALMVLMTWIMSTITQNQLQGGDDATGNMPGFIFLYAFFPMFFSICTIGLWLVDVYYPPLMRAAIQGGLMSVSAVLGFFVGWNNPWSVFLGNCDKGSSLCRTVWKKVIRIEGVAVILIGFILVMELVDALAALRLWRLQKSALRRPKTSQKN
ncbi:hypothetical protein CPB86DRAFT_62942 [Serendipita vermifera]|nr:hypothetical protein CPB86DRAFT_62942 [Serendipita vermifera]